MKSLISITDRIACYIAGRTGMQLVANAIEFLITPIAQRGGLK